MSFDPVKQVCVGVSSIEGHEAHVEEPPFLLDVRRNQLAVTPCRLGPGAVPSVPPAQFASPGEVCAADRTRRQRGQSSLFAPSPLEARASILFLATRRSAARQ